MRRLLYVPIIHDEADMGATGASLAERSAAVVGERLWSFHQETMGRFWREVGAYLLSLAPRCLAVYQDGLAAEGPLASRIVAEAARRGSANYRLLLELARRGAQLLKTEDPSLLLQEREQVLGSLRQGEDGGPGWATELLERRDSFIAETIHATLTHGSIGVLFIGAHHTVAPRLASDIRVQMVKDPVKVRSYFEALFRRSDGEQLRRLAEHLAAPVALGEPELSSGP